MKKGKKATTIGSREELETVLGEYARVAIERGRMGLTMDAKLTDVRKAYEARFADLDAQIEGLRADLEAWAVLNPSEFPEGRKSMELTHGTIGFRLGTPALKTVRGVRWDDVLEQLRINRMDRYIRKEESPNKERLLEDREALGEDRLRLLGMQVAQTERFFVAPRLETEGAR